MKYVIILSLLVIGCSTDGVPERLDGKLLKDENGTYYEVNHQIGDNVTLDTAVIQKAF